jgi:hypothetical protein
VVEVGEQVLLSFGRGVEGVVASEDRGGNGPVFSDEGGSNFGDVSLQLKEGMGVGVGQSAVIKEDFICVIWRKEVIFVFIIHVSSVGDSEEGFGPVSNGERDVRIWG